jgi:hypothetical protein
VDDWNVISWSRDISCGTGVGDGGTVVDVSSVVLIGCSGLGLLYCRSKPAMRRICASILFFISVILLMVSSLSVNVRPSTSVMYGGGIGSKVTVHEVGNVLGVLPRCD